MEACLQKNSGKFFYYEREHKTSNWSKQIKTLQYLSTINTNVVYLICKSKKIRKIKKNRKSGLA